MAMPFVNEKGPANRALIEPEGHGAQSNCSLLNSSPSRMGRSRITPQSGVSASSAPGKKNFIVVSLKQAQFSSGLVESNQLGQPGVVACLSSVEVLSYLPSATKSQRASKPSRASAARIGSLLRLRGISIAPSASPSIRWGEWQCRGMQYSVCS